MKNKTLCKIYFSCLFISVLGNFIEWYAPDSFDSAKNIIAHVEALAFMIMVLSSVYIASRLKDVPDKTESNLEVD